MNKKIIVFSGPPHCGKDTAAKATMAYLQAYACHEKMSDRLKKAVHALYGLTYSPEYYDEPRNADEKNMPLNILFGMSPRQAYISLSEDYMKPQFGVDVFGRIKLNDIKKNKTAVCHVFSDGGFVDEWVPIIDFVGDRHCLIVEIKANKGGVHLDFGNDSRSYIGSHFVARYPRLSHRVIYNDIGTHEDKEMFRMMVQSCVKQFIEGQNND